MISETSLHDDIQDNEVLPPNFRLTCKDKGSLCGGVAIAVKKKLVCPSMDDVDSAETVRCKLNFFRTFVTFGALYRQSGRTPEDLKIILYYLIANSSTQSKLVIGATLTPRMLLGQMTVLPNRVHMTPMAFMT